MKGYEYQSDFARKYFNEGLQQGEAQGEARGEARGEAKGEAKAILSVLEARGLAVPADVRDHVLACTDTSKLEAWVRAAVTVGDARQLLKLQASTSAARRRSGRGPTRS